MSAAAAPTSTISDRKRAANQANAQKSTGPKTPEGKERSSKNATTHGLYAATLLLPTESERRYHALRHLLLDSMNPQDATELFFAEQVVTAAWRLNRVNDADFYNHHMESERLQTEHEQFKADHPKPNANDDDNDKDKDKDTNTDTDDEFPPLPPGFVIAAAIRRSLDGDTPGGASKTTPFERLLNAQHRLMSHVYRAMRELRTLQTARRKAEHQAGIPPNPICPFVPEDAHTDYLAHPDDDDANDANATEGDVAQHGATPPPSTAQNEPVPFGPPVAEVT